MQDQASSISSRRQWHAHGLIYLIRRSACLRKHKAQCPYSMSALNTQGQGWCLGNFEANKCDIYLAFETILLPLSRLDVS